MNKNEFISTLKKRLDGVPIEDINKSVDYYSEMIEERREEGMSEEEAVEALGNIEDIISQILSEAFLPKQAEEKEKPECELTGNKQSAKKITVIAAAVIMAAGLFCCIVLLTINNFDMNTIKWETNTYVVEEEFKNISINGEEAEISLAPSEDDSCKVVCTESERVYNVIEVRDETLAIERVNERKWNRYIGVFADEIKLTVYLPKAEYEKLTINNSSGGMELEKCDAGNLKLEATSGNIEGTLLSEKTFLADATSGNVEVPRTTTGGRCEVATSSGDIFMSITE